MIGSRGSGGDGPPFGDEGRWNRRSRRVASGRRWLRRLGLLLGAAGALAALGLAALWITLPDPRPLTERWPEGSAYMELRRDQARAEGRELDIRWEPVPLDRIPDHVERAVRVAEDAMFYRHGGVDWYEVRSSLREWWSDDERLRGASTITMQLARNLYLSPERSLLRKLREILLALRLERRLGKDRILELYLNIVELGPGVFGVEAASRHYWGVSVAGLDRRRAAELAATLPSPLEDNPTTRTGPFRWRVDLIRRRAFGSAGARADTAAPPASDTTAPGGADTVRPTLPSPDTVGTGTFGPSGDGPASGPPRVRTTVPGDGIGARPRRRPVLSPPGRARRRTGRPPPGPRRRAPTSPGARPR